MKSIFIDCNDQLAPVWDKVIRPDDPAIEINRKAFIRDELPRVLNGYEIALDDHSYCRPSWSLSARNSNTLSSWAPVPPAT